MKHLESLMTAPDALWFETSEDLRFFLVSVKAMII
jgi:hypothetical protein